MTKQDLFDQIKKKESFLCVGLDTDIQKIPKHLLELQDPKLALNFRTALDLFKPDFIILSISKGAIMCLLAYVLIISFSIKKASIVKPLSGIFS